ncbi:sialidase [uncultured Dokdonia sp.]|uniref:sialidase n=1 Tax=uncultured Dokdonia sp. TaxID=575653 RepID=UPI0030ED1C04|tara:strand:- start:16270 stop:17514 length:1245 start_codon:yes stop_codon:yes gene_type:complete
MRITGLVFFVLIFFTSCKKANQTETAPLPEQPALEVATVNASLTTINLPSTGKSHLPRLKASGGKLHMTWVEQEGKQAILKYASYDSAKWSQPRTITSGDNWFVNWADFPALGINGDYLLTNILEKSAEGTYDYNIKLQLSKGDQIIKDDFLLNTDDVDAEHGFVSIQAYDGGFYASWLDGRNTKNEDKSKNQMTLRNAYIDLAGNITQDTEIDNRVCDCCNTAIAITNNGPITVYRDRTETKPEVRDMAIVRWVDGAWSKPMVIGNDNWELNGCPVNGPAVATQEENVVVSWFTAEGDAPRVLTAFSNDNGASFGGAIRIDNGDAIGRVDTDFMSDGSALISWLEPMGNNVVLQVARVYVDGTHDTPVTVTNTSAERQSGFPQLEIIGDEVYVAWTDLDGEKSQVKMVRFEMK